MKTRNPKTSNCRKPLCSLEPNTIEKENVGVSTAVSTKDIHRSISKDKNFSPKKNLGGNIEAKLVQETSVQTETQIDVNDLISTEPPSEGYWKLLAEQRLKALEKTLKENEELHLKIESLEKQKKAYREMLEETTALVNVLQEMLEQNEDDLSDGN